MRGRGPVRRDWTPMNTTSALYDDYVVFVESKSLRGRSKEEYLRQVRKLMEHYPQCSLRWLTERQVFDYLIFRRDEQKLRPSTLNQAVVALRMQPSNCRVCSRLMISGKGWSRRISNWRQSFQSRCRKSW